jgi:hypothetical protein
MYQNQEANDQEDQSDYDDKLLPGRALHKGVDKRKSDSRTDQPETQQRPIWTIEQKSLRTESCRACRAKPPLQQGFAAQRTSPTRKARCAWLRAKPSSER